MQETKKQHLRLLKKGANINILSQKLQPREVTLSSNLYRSTLTLPLWIFVRCLLFQEYRLLLRSGNATDLELTIAWKDIERQYTEHLSGEQGKRFLNLQTEVALQEGKLKKIMILAKLLSTVLDIEGEEVDEVKLMLNRLCRTKFTFEYSQEGIHEIQRCINRSTGMQISLELKHLQLEEMAKTMEGRGKDVSEKWFRDTIITLQDHSKSPAVNYDTITAYDFVERIIRYKQYLKDLKNSNNGKRR